MRTKKTLSIALIALIVLPAMSFARSIDPFVSTAWLEKNLSNPQVVIIDTRKVEEYRDGHVPGAVNVVQASWLATRGGITNELPEADDLSDLISGAGIKADSQVVLVGKTFGEFTWITRVAWTLLYAGVENVAILDGAYEKWVKDGKAVSKDAAKPKATGFKAAPKKDFFASKDYVIGKIGKTAMLDARSPDVYFGVNKQGFVSQFGHIAGALNLPTIWIVGPENLVRDKAELEAMAANLFKNKGAEVVTYCDSGVLATGWWYVLHEVLGYKDVKSYDGSSQEITKDPKVKYVRYTWN